MNTVASEFELNLAQFHTTEYVEGLERGIAVAQTHELVFPGEVSEDDITAIYKVINDQSIAQTSAYFRGEIEEPPFYKGDAVFAVSMGMLNGVIDVLQKKKAGDLA